MNDFDIVINQQICFINLITRADNMKTFSLPYLAFMLPNRKCFHFFMPSNPVVSDHLLHYRCNITFMHKLYSYIAKLTFIVPAWLQTN